MSTIHGRGLCQMPEVLAASRVSREFVGGSQTGGTGVPPVIVEQKKRPLLQATAVNCALVPTSPTGCHSHRGPSTRWVARQPPRTRLRER